MGVVGGGDKNRLRYWRLHCDTPQALIDNTETIHNGYNASDLQVTKQTKKGVLFVFFLRFVRCWIRLRLESLRRKFQ